MRERTLPHAPDAEVAVLGGLLIDWDAAPVAFDRLGPADFYDRRNRAVFEAMADLFRRGDVADPITVSEALKQRGALERAGGIAYLSELLDAVPTAATMPYHVGLVVDRALRRRLHAAGSQIAADALDGEMGLEELIDRAERRILQVAEGRSVEGPRRIQEVLWGAMHLIEQGGVPGVPSGLVDVDELTGGFKPGNLVIVAGAVSMGKSAFALQCAAHAAVRQKVPTAVFSIEMTRTENTIRLFAIEGILDLHAMLNGKLPEHDLPRLVEVARQINESPILLDDTATRVMEIRARARRIKAEHGLGLVVVDHIHDMAEEGESRREQLGTIARGLRQLAKELDVPVLAVSQLSRAPTMRADRRPQLSDLRETGDIEASANLVILMYRPEYYFGPRGPDGEDLRGKAEAIIAKNRNGPTGSVNLYFRAPCARFESVAREREDTRRPYAD